MIQNYLKIALRTLGKYKTYSFINIAGLAIGITCSVLMFMWVQDELSYDRFHAGAGELHRILLDPQGAAATHEAVSPPHSRTQDERRNPRSRQCDKADNLSLIHI